MIPELDAAEVRVLGCLVEKEAATPEYYPLTLNALVNACNQKSNRDPIVAYDEDTVVDTLDSLRAKGLITVLTGGGNRVPKYGHRLQERLNLGRREMAVLCELMLRNGQTLNELRDRTSRMHRFSDNDEVESVLRAMGEREKPLAVKLPLRPGAKEHRYAHLLAGEPVLTAGDTPRGSSDRAPGGLEAEVASLRDRMAALEDELRRLKEQLGA